MESTCPAQTVQICSVNPLDIYPEDTISHGGLECNDMRFNKIAFFFDKSNKVSINTCLTMPRSYCVLNS